MYTTMAGRMAGVRRNKKNEKKQQTQGQKIELETTKQGRSLLEGRTRSPDLRVAAAASTAVSPEHCPLTVAPEDWLTAHCFLF